MPPVITGVLSSHLTLDFGVSALIFKGVSLFNGVESGPGVSHRLFFYI